MAPRNEPIRKNTPSENGHSALDENSPLLASNADDAPANEEEIFNHNGTTAKDDDLDRLLPKLQIALLCYSRVVEPISFFCIFPYINQMIFETGVREVDVGFYSGLIESLFSLAGTLLMIFWGRAADRLGRKPVLLFSLCGAAISMALFGFSKRVWQMIVCRCLAGMFGGTIVTIRAMISENSTPKTQARAFGFFAFAGNLGIMLGPVIGGVLEEPAKQYPRIFGNIGLLKEYPYALPTLFTGVMTAISALVNAIYLKETLDPEFRQGSSKSKTISTMELLQFEGVKPVIFIYSHVMILAMFYTAVVPVMWFTAIPLGGYGLTPKQISLLMCLSGLSQALWLLLIFPPLQHRLGTGGVLRLCAAAWPLFFLAAPLGSVLLRHRLDVAAWCVVLPALAVGSGVSMAFTAVQLALNDISPSPQTLGTLNALALAANSGVRTVAPSLATSLFALSVREQILGGYLVWAILVALGVALVGTVRWLPRLDGLGI
ncbi:MFS general substrate transporter [Patellaria atrata CBS 101060]|uniref:MFS general substrate transporter n=1 Tax=Patellaria atrata CBS 101060 TaxID=1346257 RepID=A0A9P4VTW9_9PEZI|nr:MFS general substrate transporter [Patellaria atrata CBS 101060]